jgi:beta-glucosidase
MDAALPADERARLLEEALTEDERYGLLHGIMPLPMVPGTSVPPGAIPAAGYFPPIERLGVPGLYETDASLGVSNPGGVRPGDTATALPSGLALAATWDPDLAREAGAAIGDEAAKKGFNVLLAGGVNLARDPRCGRNFEYLGEDPLLAGVLAGESIAGIQSQGIVSTAKHFVLNDQETGRHVVNAVIDEAALRESDLLAFQIAIERGRPGAIMSAYNRINGLYACENEALLTGVLKGDWGYPGWVMTDWGGLSSDAVTAANAGVDQQSGEQLDHKTWFDEPLREAVASGAVSRSRVSDMSRRILRSMFAAGLFDRPSPKGQPIDLAAHAEVARRTAEQGIVLLKNARGLLPLAGTARRILVVGGQADAGVLSGAGSSQVTTGKGHAAVLRVGGEGGMTAWANEVYHPSSPLKAIRARAPEAELRFSTGRYPSEAAALAAEADVALVFATQWMGEGFDAPDLSLPNGQDALIAAVAAANPNTVVVLETGGPVLMPWLDQVGAVLQAWYPGARGGEAIAAVLFGESNPSGRLPMTFPASLDQLPRPTLPGFGRRWASPGGAAVDLSQAEGFDAPHPEGAEVGYRGFARQGHPPLFPFGFGLSYTTFAYSDLEAAGGEWLTVGFTVANTGERAGTDIPQLYLGARNGVPKTRLLGWSKVFLEPGESRRVSVAVDPRLLADFDVAARGWRIGAGAYDLSVSPYAGGPQLAGVAHMDAARLKP